MENLRLFTLFLFACLAFLLSGCDLIVGIFEAGFWVGFILVLLIIGLIFYLLRRGRR